MKEKYSLGELSGPDGNAYVIMEKVINYMKQEGYSDVMVQKYLKDAKASDYDNLVEVSQDMIDRLNSR